MNQSESSTPGDRFAQILQFQTPAALAWIRGNTPYAPGLSGMVRFYDTPYGGVLIEGEFFRLPNKGISGSTDFYALHIHENGDCSAGFTRTGGHYNPTGTSHPWHSGDLLPVMGNSGYGWLAVALVIFATWSPARGMLVALVFGGLTIMRMYINIPGLPAQIYDMFPYIATILVLVITSMRRSKEHAQPKSCGLNYFREER